MLFINNNGSTHLSNCIQKTFGFFPSKTWIGNRFSVNMITSDLLISRFNITLDHKPFYQSMKFRVYLAAVENLFCNTNLLVILFIRIRVVGINYNSRIFKVFLLIFFPEKTKMCIRDRLATVRNAERIYYDKKREWNKMVDRAMAADFSWGNSARQYEEMYNWLIGDK